MPDLPLSLIFIILITLSIVAFSLYPSTNSITFADKKKFKIKTNVDENIDDITFEIVPSAENKTFFVPSQLKTKQDRKIEYPKPTTQDISDIIENDFHSDSRTIISKTRSNSHTRKIDIGGTLDNKDNTTEDSKNATSRQTTQYHYKKRKLITS